jgi:hypothetical protein
MSILGNPNIGTGTQGTDVGLIVLNRVQATEAGILTTIQCWVDAADASYAELIYVVYAGDENAPTFLLNASNAFHSPPDGGGIALKESALDSAVPLVTDAYYWIGMQVKHDSTYVSEEGDVSAVSYRLYGGAFGVLPDLTGVGTIDAETRYAFSGIYSAPGAAIISINDGDPVVIGQTATMITTGIAGLFEMEIGGIPVTDLTEQSENNYTFTMPFFIDGASFPTISTLAYVEITYEGSPVTSNALVELPSGWVEVEVVSLSSAPDSLYSAAIGVEIKLNNKLYANSADITLYDDTTFSNARAGTVYVWNADEDGNVMTRISIINGAVVPQGGAGFIGFIEKIGFIS